jgi:hypothetical protein
MKYILYSLLLLGIAKGHLLENEPASAKITFKNGHSTSLGINNDGLSELIVVLLGRTIIVPQEDLSDLSFPDLTSVKLLETDLDKVKGYLVALKFGVAPDVHGSIRHSASATCTVKFSFSEGRYVGRVVILPDPPDSFDPGPRYFKEPGQPETPAGRTAGKTIKGEHGSGQPAPRSESKLEGGDKLQPEAEGRSR